MHKLEDFQEKAILVAAIRSYGSKTCKTPLVELEQLAKTANIEILGQTTQVRKGKLQPFNPNTYIGKGKVEEIKLAAAELEANLIIFDNDLSPCQSRNLEKLLELRVIDRTELILYIFATHAKSRESKLLLWSIIFATVVFFGHILFFIYENETALIYVKFGYILVFLFVSMLLLQRFSYSFQKLEFAKKIALQQKLEISTQSKALKEVNLKLEENLKLLESNNEELEDFNHIVSHDLKTPLISVYSLASFIQEDLKDKLDPNTENYLKMMKDVVSKMEASINGLLEYAKVAKGNKRKEWVSVYDILKKVIGLIDHQNKSTFNFPKKDLEIYTNKLELEHVFQNLFSNSMKYNDKEQTIITIDVAIKNKEYLFSVSDNGPGIEPQYHEKIFKIFSQLETNPKDINSTGIGLAIVKKIISNNNGVLSVNSEKGKGFTINFTWQLDIETTKILKNKNL